MKNTNVNYLLDQTIIVTIRYLEIFYRCSKIKKNNLYYNK